MNLWGSQSQSCPCTDELKKQNGGIDQMKAAATSIRLTHILHLFAEGLGVKADNWRFTHW